MSATGEESVSERPCKGDINVVPGRFKFDVIEPVFWADPGETYTIGNRTRYTIDVIFPLEVVADGLPITIPPNQCGSFTTRADGFGVYEYDVMVKLSPRAGDVLFASGGSNPRIVFN